MDGFKFDEIGELEKDILELAKDQFPKETKKFVIEEAKKGKEIAKSIAQTELNKKTGRYLKGFKTGKSGLKDKFSYKFFNDSPHGGSRRSGAGGAKNGFVEGKKIFLKAQVQVQSEFAKDVDEFISKLMDKTFK